MRILLIPALFLATPAVAQTSATVSVGTDYIARGTSQTYNKPAVTVYAEHQEGNFYLGAFAANVDFDDGTEAEADVMAGYRGEIEGVNVDVGTMYISYHGSQSTNWNMVEAHVSASKTVGRVTGTLYVGASPDYFNYAGKSLWTEASIAVPVDRATFSASAGYQLIEKDVSYATWSLGASYDLGAGFGADVKYVDTDWKPIGVRYLDKIYAPRVVATLRKTF